MRRLALFLALLPAFGIADISYTVAPEVDARSIRVVVQLEAKSSETVLRIPAWCPGYYVLQDYQKKISDVKATDELGHPLSVDQPDSRGWRIKTRPGGKVSLSYRVLGDDQGLGFFAVSVKPHTVFINGPAAFMYAEGRLAEPVHLEFDLPAGWQVATAMNQKGPDRWTAEGYDELADHPIQLGKFERRSFVVEGFPMEAIFVTDSGAPRCNPDVEAKELTLLSKPAIKMMGGAPFKKFIYFVHLAIGDFSGGLEHRSSTVLAVANSSRLHLDELATHEFFHAWNVKQIRPRALGPFDYTQKVRVRGLWFSEGVTEYFALRHAYHSGIRDAEGMIARMGNQIAELQESDTRKTKTVEDASLEAWEGGSMGIGDLSYYTKGSVAGLIFDAAIRDATNGAKSLDDVMRLMYERYHLPKPGFDDDGILKAMNEVAGADLSDLYRRVVQSTEEVPYDVLAKIGLRLRAPGNESHQLGFSLENDVVRTLGPEVQEQGLVRGDQIVRVGERAFGPGCFSEVQAGRAYDLTVMRDGKAVTLHLKTLATRSPNAVLEIDPFATEKAEKLREGWLKKPY